MNYYWFLKFTRTIELIFKTLLPVCNFRFLTQFDIKIDAK